MIIGAHIIVFSTNAEADRLFMRDVLGFSGVDAGEGWLIFKLPPSELAIHPSAEAAKHELYFMCDDIQATLTDLTAKGVEISMPIRDEGWGLIASIQLPGGSPLSIYQPRHPTAYNLAE